MDQARTAFTTFAYIHPGQLEVQALETVGQALVVDA